MNLKKLFILAAFSLAALLSPKPAFAAITCEIAKWDPIPRNVQICVGGFDSLDQMSGTVLDYHCIGNSNLPDSSVCNNIQNPTYTLGSPVLCTNENPTNCDTAVDANGKFYTCPIAQGLSRAVGKMEVIVYKNSSQICKTNSFYTRPADWDPLTEGLPWQTSEDRTGLSAECIRDGVTGVATALGCIPTDFTGGGFITALLRLLMGIGSGIALLLVLYGIFIVTTSAGIPDKLNQGRDIISSAIAGLVFIILSIFLLNLIGVKILAIPGL